MVVSVCQLVKTKLVVDEIPNKDKESRVCATNRASTEGEKNSCFMGKGVALICEDEIDPVCEYKKRADSGDSFRGQRSTKAKSQFF